MSDPTWDAGGDAITAQADNGAEFLTTYGLPAAIVVLGAGTVLALTVKFGRKVRGWL